MANEEGLHPGRRSIRLKGYDYSAPAQYFVTVCSHGKACTFGQIARHTMSLSDMGAIVRDCWLVLPRHFAEVQLHAFVVMPNHFHGIVEIGERANATSNQGTDGSRSEAACSLGAIVRSFKSAVTLRVRRELGIHRQIWQRNYFERVLGGSREYADACRYIQMNEVAWGADRENPRNKRRS